MNEKCWYPGCDESPEFMIKMTGDRGELETHLLCKAHVEEFDAEWSTIVPLDPNYSEYHI